MSMKEAYENKLQAQLDECKAEMLKFKAKADEAEADAQIEYNKQIEELESKKASVDAKLSDLKDAGEDAWEDIKVGADSAWDSLSDALKSAASRFK